MENEHKNPAVKTGPERGPNKYNLYDSNSGEKLNSTPLTEEELPNQKSLWESKGKSPQVRQILNS